ncbi:MAG: flagellar filament capping protein FliD, partial [Marinovum sp.]|nr:flagellar filament capping protein FliD [Marinovum sp.]
MDSGTSIISKVNQSGSGIDLSDLVTSLVEAETSPLQSALDKKVEAANLSISSLGQLSSKMSSLSTNLTTLENTNARTTTSSGTAVSLTVTDEAKARDINANIVVSALATGQVVTYDLTHANLLNSSSVTAASAIDQGTLTFTKGGTSTTITISSANNTVQGLMDALNAISGVQANLVDASGSGGLALVIKSDTGTANAFTLTSSDTLTEFNTGSPAASNTSAQINLSVAAADASFTVDGLAVTRSTNSLTDVFDGYQLDLNAVNSSATNVSSAIIATNARDRMQSFIDNINSVKSYLTTETKRGLSGETNGSLVGDITAQAILRELSGLTTKPITGYGDSSVYLANLGVKTERDGSLSLDATKFDKEIAADPSLADIVFASKYQTTNANITATGSANYPPTAGSYSFVYASGDTATLNGETITKVENSNSQKVFTATNGAADNLSVTLLSNTATNATVRYGQSVIDRLQAYITTVTSSSGSIKNSTNSLNEKLSSFVDEQTDLDAKINNLTETYNVKFGSMESLVTQLNKTGEYLTSMMDAWNKKD